MSDYVECVECGFTVVADGSGTPQPRRVDSCPGCESEEFQFPSAESDTE